MGQGNHVELTVKGMTCKGCVSAVTKAIKRVDPAAHVIVDLKSGRISVTTLAAAEQLAKTVSAGGYEAHVG